MNGKTRKIGCIDLDLLNIQSNCKVLDVGCSEGYISIAFAELGLKVYGVEPSEKLIKKFENKLRNDKELNCFLIKGSAINLPFKDNYFDIVIITEVLEHIQETDRVLEEIYRVLNENGRMCLSVPTSCTEKLFSKLHPKYNKNSGHVKVFREKELIELLKRHGFEIYAKRNCNFEWSVFWIIHSILQSDFEFTGTPIENFKMTKVYWLGWVVLSKIRLKGIVLWIGNKLFPKSIYLYCERIKFE